jgi:hypothetical protein
MYRLKRNNPSRQGDTHEPSTWEAEVQGTQVPGQPRLQIKTLSQKKHPFRAEVQVRLGGKAFAYLA